MTEEPTPPTPITRFLQMYALPIALGGCSLLAISISLILLVKSTASPPPIEFSSGETASGSSVLGRSVILVDVEGAVAHPGLYTLPEGSRVEDALSASGGLEANADSEYIARSINRAMKLVDGAKLYFPVGGQSHDNQSVVSAQSEPNNSLISVNTASQSRLETLTGVGPVTAKKIIDNRPYQTLDELVSKKSLGTALFEKIRNQLSL